ncbi:MAG TPA: hypothetical protein VN369_08420 [Terriglobales bacterium]|nr:hypothetical protein [Terriglobales bacterium]
MELLAVRRFPAEGAGFTVGPDGFYLTQPESLRILRFNRELEQTGEFPVPVRFTVLCYDRGEDCFWGYVPGTPLILYRMNRELGVESQSILAWPELAYEIVSISVDCAAGLLVLTTDDAVWSFQRDGKYAGRILRAAENAVLEGAAAINPWIVARYRRGTRVNLALVNSQGVMVGETPIRGRFGTGIAVDMTTPDNPQFFALSGGQLQLWSLGERAAVCNFDQIASPRSINDGDPLSCECRACCGNCDYFERFGREPALVDTRTVVLAASSAMESAMASILSAPGTSEGIIAQVASIEQSLLEKLRIVDNIINRTDCC